MICFEFIIFALSITAKNVNQQQEVVLWFASNLLFLHYQSQLGNRTWCRVLCCDLLRIYYFCTINHSQNQQENKRTRVVICFEFIIFALSITAKLTSRVEEPMLWFASNLLFLHYQSQLWNIFNIRLNVVICFEFIIFALSITAQRWATCWGWCCDLLRIYYFCTINHSTENYMVQHAIVVICFEFIIFALSITAKSTGGRRYGELWFASNLLFLHYQSQLE